MWACIAADLLPLRRLGGGERQGDSAAANVSAADDGAPAQAVVGVVADGGVLLPAGGLVPLDFLPGVSLCAWLGAAATARTSSARDPDSGALVGGCELRIRPDGTGEVAYWTHAGKRGRGYATNELILPIRRHPPGSRHRPRQPRLTARRRVRAFGIAPSGR
jgi:hypothetical protein